MTAEPLGLLRMVCIATGFLLHIVPLYTIEEVYTARSTMNYHISTYAFALLDQSVSLWFALIRDDGTLVVFRSAGVLFNTVYVHTFLQYCSPSKRPEFRRTLFCAGVFFIAVFVDLNLLLPIAGLTSAYVVHIATWRAVAGICLAAGPLATIREVIRTRDASSLPLPFLLMVTIQCFFWTLYGQLLGDLSTFYGNLVGVVLGSAQLFLIFMWPANLEVVTVTLSL